jgi:hypothetical protein
MSRPTDLILTEDGIKHFGVMTLNCETTVLLDRVSTDTWKRESDSLNLNAQQTFSSLAPIESLIPKVQLSLTGDRSIVSILSHRWIEGFGKETGRK